jgi:hypothetical protein
MPFIKEKEVAAIKTIFLSLELLLLLYPCVLEDVILRITLYISYYTLFYCFHIHKGYEKLRNNTIEYYEKLEY